MDLALGGASSNGAPAYQARQVLRDNHVEKFSPCWYSHFCQVEKKTTGQPEAIVDFEGLIKMRIVNQPFPTNSCAWFLEIDPHDKSEVRGQFGDCRLEKSRIFARSVGVMNGAGPDHNQQTMILALKDAANFCAGLKNGRRCPFGHRHLFFQEDWGKDNFGPFNPNVMGALEHRGFHLGGVPTYVNAWAALYT